MKDKQYKDAWQELKDKRMEEGAKDMKSFEGKLKDLQDKLKNKEINSIEWAQENEETDGSKTIITTKFKYEIPTPIKSKDLKLEDKQND